jgi:hypothetical protein
LGESEEGEVKAVDQDELEFIKRMLKRKDEATKELWLEKQLLRNLILDSEWMAEQMLKQQQAIRILLDVLTSRGLLTGDDEQAFQAAQMQDISANAALFREVKAKYLVLAKSLDLQTGLERLEDFPDESFRPPKP